jgi:hypothetical protein
VSLSAFEASWGWTLTFLTPPCPPLAEIRVGMDGKKPVSLGRRGSRETGGGLPDAVHELVLADETLWDGEHVLAVELVRPGGKVDGPYELRFAPLEERLAHARRELEMAPRTWASFAEHGSVWTWLGFHNAFGMTGLVREIRYSVDGCGLEKRVVFSQDIGAEPKAERSPEHPDDLTFDRPFVSLPKQSSRSACVQVVFVDGTESAVLGIVRAESERVAPED